MAPRQVQAEARPQDPQGGVLGSDGEGHLRGPGAQQLWTRQIDMKIHIPAYFYFKGWGELISGLTSSSRHLKFRHLF